MTRVSFKTLAPPVFPLKGGARSKQSITSTTTKVASVGARENIKHMSGHPGDLGHALDDDDSPFATARLQLNPKWGVEDKT